MTETDPYQAALLAKARTAAEDRPLDAPSASATVDNPLCADRVTIDVRLDGGRVVALGWRVRACVLCQAATALMAESIVDGETAVIAAGEAAVRDLLEGGADPGGRFAAFAMFRSVSAYPSRHDCVLLPFEALARAVGPTGG